MLPEIVPQPQAAPRVASQKERTVLVLAHPSDEAPDDRLLSPRLAERAELVGHLRGALGLVGYRQLRATRGGLKRLIELLRSLGAGSLRRPVRSNLTVVELFEFATEQAAVACLRSSAAIPTWNVLASGAVPARPQALLSRLRVIVSPADRAQVTAMLFVRRSRSLALSQMQAYWWDRHRLLVERLSSGLGYDAYRQFHRSDCQPTGPWQTSTYDGIAALTFDSAARIMATLASPQGHLANLALLRDEKHFIEGSDPMLFLAREEVVF